MKRKVLLTIIVVLLIVSGVAATFLLRQKSSDTQLNSNSNAENSTTTSNTSPQTGLNKQQYSLTDPTSIWVIVNKKNPLPLSYEPTLVVPEVTLRLGSSEEQMQISSAVEPAVKEMFKAAKDEGITLVFGSGYRSAALQRQFYDSYKAKDGQQAADTYSARPGHSEHQSGLAFDLTSKSGTCHLQICWEDTPEGKWVAANAYKYGFTLRYQKGKENITGYQYEPWHFRYVGKELATELYNLGQTLEEFFGYPPAPNYD